MSVKIKGKDLVVKGCDISPISHTEQKTISHNSVVSLYSYTADKSGLLSITGYVEGIPSSNTIRRLMVIYLRRVDEARMEIADYDAYDTSGGSALKVDASANVYLNAGDTVTVGIYYYNTVTTSATITAKVNGAFIS